MRLRRVQVACWLTSHADCGTPRASGADGISAGPADQGPDVGSHRLHCCQPGCRGTAIVLYRKRRWVLGQNGTAYVIRELASGWGNTRGLPGFGGPLLRTRHIQPERACPAGIDRNREAVARLLAAGRAGRQHWGARTLRSDRRPGVQQPEENRHRIGVTVTRAAERPRRTLAEHVLVMAGRGKAVGKPVAFC
jgi:hypothetical protein